MLKSSCFASLIFILSINCPANQVFLTLINEVKLGIEPKDILLFEDRAYIITENELYSVSTKDPSQPDLLDYDGMEGTSSVSFTGRIAYVTGSFDGIKYFDLTKYPPVYKSKIITTGTIRKILIDNGYLYVLNNSLGLQIYDVNIADFPLYKNTQIIPGDANGIFVKDRKAYVTGANANLYIIDANDISKLPIVGNYNYGTNFYEVYVDGNYAFLPQGSTGVQVLNISKLPFPEHVANIFARRFARQVVSSNFYAWVADEYSVEGFFNYDAKSFLFAGNYKNGNSTVNRIAVIEGKYIYVCSSDKKLKILRIDYKY